MAGTQKVIILATCLLLALSIATSDAIANTRAPVQESKRAVPTTARPTRLPTTHWKGGDSIIPVSSGRQVSSENPLPILPTGTDPRTTRPTTAAPTTRTTTQVPTTTPTTAAPTTTPSPKTTVARTTTVAPTTKRAPVTTAEPTRRATEDAIPQAVAQRLGLEVEVGIGVALLVALAVVVGVMYHRNTGNFQDRGKDLARRVKAVIGSSADPYSIPEGSDCHKRSLSLSSIVPFHQSQASDVDSELTAQARKQSMPVRVQSVEEQVTDQEVGYVAPSFQTNTSVGPANMPGHADIETASEYAVVPPMGNIDYEM